MILTNETLPDKEPPMIRRSSLPCDGCLDDPILKVNQCNYFIVKMLQH
jgi:hypothetical protein